MTLQSNLSFRTSVDMAIFYQQNVVRGELGTQENLLISISVKYLKFFTTIWTLDINRFLGEICPIYLPLCHSVKEIDKAQNIFGSYHQIL